MSNLPLMAMSLAVVLAELVVVQSADPDLWGRLSMGAVIFQTGSFPSVDDFSYTARGAHWIDHEWLTGTVLYGILASLGGGALTLFKYSIAGGILLMVFFAHRTLYAASPALAAYAFTLLSPAYVHGFMFTVRSQVFSFFFFTVSLLLLERVRLRRSRLRALLWLVPMGVVWGNLHGGVAVGLLLPIVYGAGALAAGRAREAVAHAAVALAMFAVLGVVNPYGVAYLDFLVHAWTMERGDIVEWRPLTSFGAQWVAALAPAVLVAFAMAGVGAWRSLAGWRAAERRARGPSSLFAPSLVLLMTASMSLVAVRMLPFAAISVGAYLPLFAPALWQGRGRRGSGERRPGGPGRVSAWVQRGIPSIAFVATVVAIALLARDRPVLDTMVPDERHAATIGKRVRYPVGAAHFLRNSRYSGNLLNPFNEGEFLLWMLYPKFRVSMDGRYEEVYTQTQASKVRRFYYPAREDRARTLRQANRSGADFILFRRDMRTLAIVASSADWRVVYGDPAFVVLGRESLTDRGPAAGPGAPAESRPRTIASFVAPQLGQHFRDYPVR